MRVRARDMWGQGAVDGGHSSDTQAEQTPDPTLPLRTVLFNSWVRWARSLVSVRSLRSSEAWVHVVHTGSSMQTTAPTTCHETRMSRGEADGQQRANANTGAP